MADRICKVAIVGIGTVGGEVARGIIRDADLIAEKTGIRLVLSHVVDKNGARAAELGLENLLCPSVDAVIADSEVQVVVELVGGTTFARTVIEKALKAGKSVVTANKALLATHGHELLSLAREHGTSISFEASCEGGVPIIENGKIIGAIGVSGGTAQQDGVIAAAGAAVIK